MPRRKAEEQPEYLTQSDLLEGSWTKSGIALFLGDPDATRTNPKYATAAKLKLFLRERVEQVETSEEFGLWLQKSMKRRSAAQGACSKKRQALLSAACKVKVNIPVLKEKKLLKRALYSYNMLRGDSSGYPASKDSETDFLHRICVNYIRHELTHYESVLGESKGKVGVKEVYSLINRRIYDVIAEKYPYLEEECKRQMEGKLDDTL